LGATVTGVDISDEAINLARKLSEATAIPATFYRSDVLEWLASMREKPLHFDRAYCSYGAIRWIADLNAWAKGIFTLLRSGGCLVIIDFHPFATMFNRNWQLAYPYRVGGEIVTLKSGVGTSIQLSKDAAIPFLYDAGNEAFSNPTPGHFFNWGLGEIVTTLAMAGFCITRLNEYPYSRYQHFNDMRETLNQCKVPPAHIPPFPLLFGIVATKGIQDL
jgi:SAM-dependent methyltransferase